MLAASIAVEKTTLDHRGLQIVDGALRFLNDVGLDDIPPMGIAALGHGHIEKGPEASDIDLNLGTLGCGAEEFDRVLEFSLWT